MTVDTDAYLRGNIVFPVNFAADVPSLAALEARAGREIPIELAGLRSSLKLLSAPDRAHALALLDEQDTPAARRVVAQLRLPSVWM